MIGRWVLDAAAYAELSPGAGERGSFFPAYRAPRVVGSSVAEGER